jgi:hypothetical protein
VSSKRSDKQTQDLDKQSTIKVIITVLVLIACWALWFLLKGGWVTILVLSIVGCLAAEYLGFKLLSRNKWFEQLSVEHSGFSIWRIILGVIVVVLITVVIILARLLFLRVFY